MGTSAGHRGNRDRDHVGRWAAGGLGESDAQMLHRTVNGVDIWWFWWAILALVFSFGISYLEARPLYVSRLSVSNRTHLIQLSNAEQLTRSPYLS